MKTTMCTSSERDGIMELTRAAVVTFFPEEQPAFEAAGDQFLDLFATGTDLKSLQKRSPTEFGFGQEVVEVLKFVVLLYSLYKMYNDIRTLVAKTKAFEKATLGERWVDILAAEGIDRALAKRIVERFVEELAECLRKAVSNNPTEHSDQ